MRLKDKAAVITGSSRGVGRSIAEAYAAEGASVVVNYTSNESAAQEVVDTISKSGGKAVAVKANVAEKADADKLVQASIDNFGRFSGI